MTQESIISNHVDDVSPSGSAYSSGEIYRMTLEENGDLFMENNGDLRGIANGDVLDRVDSGSLIINSPGTHLGTKVMIKVDGPTTFVTGGNKCLENGEFANGGVRANPTKKIRHNVKYFFIPSALVFLLLLIIVSLIIYRKLIFDKKIIFPNPDPNTNVNLSGFPVYFKANWGALEQKQATTKLSLPSSLIIISHSETQSCYAFFECANQTQTIQYAFTKNGYEDIGYNFLIGGEGGIYVGRGWEYENALRRNSISIAFIGDFNKEVSTTEAINAAKALIDEGVSVENIGLDYKLIGENQTSPQRFYSPGLNLVKEIKKWDHYYPGTML